MRARLCELSCCAHARTVTGCSSAWLERRVLGTGSRRFESDHPDFLINEVALGRRGLVAAVPGSSEATAAAAAFTARSHRSLPRSEADDRRLVAPRLPRRARRPPPRPRAPLGLRRPRPHRRLVVHRDVARPVLAVLRRLYAARFPIRRMVPSTPTAASDFRSIEADNTSAFNCRYVEGTTRWSEHSYGRAIDLNPIENPYVTAAGTTSHPRAARTSARAVPAGHGGRGRRRSCSAFDAAGWGWGGRWSGDRDYQHFSASGR